jgi:hypothetical protein
MAQKFGDLFRPASFLRLVRADGEPGTRVVGVADRNAGTNIEEEISITQPRLREGPTTSAIVCVVIPFWTPTRRPSLLRYGSINCAAQRKS